MVSGFFQFELPEVAAGNQTASWCSGSIASTLNCWAISPPLTLLIKSTCHLFKHFEHSVNFFYCVHKVKNTIYLFIHLFNFYSCDKVSCSSGWPFELLVFLLPLPKCLDYKYLSPLSVLSWVFMNLIELG